MALEKEDRNKEFIRAWKALGMGNKELGEKFGLSPGGVKGLKARLRKKHQELYVDEEEIKRQVDKATSAQVDKETNRQAKKKRKVSYYFNPALVQKIKIEAAKKDISASKLVEGWLSQVLLDEKI